jgi:hypothetical protein
VNLTTDGDHRGVPLHAGQSEARLAVVCRDIDAVYAMDADVSALLGHLKSPGNAPESRLLAEARLKALAEVSVHGRRRALVDIEYVEALTAGLNSAEWQCPRHYHSVLENCADAVSRESRVG